MKVSLSFYPNPQKKAQKTNAIPVYVRIRLNAKKAEGRLYHADLLENEILLWDERTMRLVDPKHKVNKLINSVQKAFDDFVILNSRNLIAYSADGIRDLLLGRGASSEPTVIDYIEKYYTNSVENNTSLSLNGFGANFLSHKKAKGFAIRNEATALGFCEFKWHKTAIVSLPKTI